MLNTFYVQSLFQTGVLHRRKCFVEAVCRHIERLEFLSFPTGALEPHFQPVLGPQGDAGL